MCCVVRQVALDRFGSPKLNRLQQDLIDSIHVEASSLGTLYISISLY